MVDPNNVTNFKRTIDELQEFLLFSIGVAGKNSSTTARALDSLLMGLRGRCSVCGEISKNESPFELIMKGLHNYENKFPDLLRKHGFGCYNQRARSFTALLESNIDLQKCAIEELEKIPGIGMKTSRFFLLHSRKGIRCAVLDTHILKFLYNETKVENVPRKTPSSKKEYLRLEQEYLKQVLVGSDLAKTDLGLWQDYSTIPWRELKR